MSLINVSKDKYKRYAVFSSLSIVFLFLILLQFIGSYGVTIGYEYYLSFAFINAIFSFILAFIIISYFSVMKELWILIVGLESIVSGTIRITEYIMFKTSFSKDTVNLKLYLLNNNYNSTNLIIGILIIYACIKNIKFSSLSYWGISSACLAAFILGIAMAYLDGHLLLNFINHQSVFYKVILSMANFAVVAAVVIALFAVIDRRSDQFTFSLILAYVFSFLREIYIFCDQGQQGAFLYWATFLYMFGKMAPFIGISLIFMEKYKTYIRITAETNKVKNQMDNFRSFLLGTPNLVFFINNRGVIEFINPIAENYLLSYYKINLLEGSSIFELDMLEEISKNFNDIIQVANRDGMWTGCLETKCLGEQEQYYYCYIKKINNNEDGKYAILLVDETHNILVTKKLQENEKKFREITDSVHDLICKLDTEGRIEYCSPSYTNLFGENYWYFKKLPWIHNVCEEDSSRVLNDIKLCINEHKIVTNECTMELATGEIIYVEYVLNPIEEMGKVDGAIISARDITRRKLAEIVMEKTEAMYSNIFNTCPDMIYVVDHIDKKVIEANIETCRFLGLDKRQIINKNIYEVCSGTDVKRIGSKIEDLHAEGTIRGIEFEYILEGKKYFLESSYSPVLEDGRLTKILCITRDISERRKINELEIERERDKRKLDEARQYDQIKTEFFANISHELRTPINVIFSALQVLDMYKDYNDIGKIPYDKYSSIMRQNCYRLLRLISNLIDITKIDAGFFKLNFCELDIVKLIEDITLSVVTYAENKGLEVIFDTNEEEIRTYCDPDKIERIILNLLSNAVKFTNKGGHISVNVCYENCNIRISVKDDGRGIPKDKLDIIFERFRQVDKSLAREKEGSGIGLSLVKSLVELHGGNIEVFSEVDKGSEFIINIPIIEELESDGNICLIEKEGANIERINIEFSDIYEIS